MDCQGGKITKSLIVYDTRWGNTERIAKAIESGMKDVGAEVNTKLADQVTEMDLKEAEVWMFGSPVHARRATGRTKQALKAAISSGAAGKKVATFDTRYSIHQGREAAERMMRELVDAGASKVMEPQNFVVVEALGPLAEGEEAKAVSLGRRIAEAISH